MTETALAGTVPAMLDGTWTLVDDATTAGFAVRNLGVRTVRGTVPVRFGAVVVAGGRPAHAHLELELNRISTGNQRRDADLAKPHLLNTGPFPLLEFTTDAVVAVPQGWTATGTLAARGRSVTVHGAVAVLGGGNDSLDLRVRAAFDRRELGIRAPRFFIGAFVHVDLQARFRRAAVPRG